MDRSLRVEASEKRPLVGTRSTFGVPTANFVLYPDWHDVAVGSNLFGDILSDLGPAPSAPRCAGTAQTRGRHQTVECVGLETCLPQTGMSVSAAQTHQLQQGVSGIPAFKSCRHGGSWPLAVHFKVDCATEPGQLGTSNAAAANLALCAEVPLCFCLKRCVQSESKRRFAREFGQSDQMSLRSHCRFGRGRPVDWDP
jgi:hypothetical protein